MRNLAALLFVVSAATASSASLTAMQAQAPESLPKVAALVADANKLRQALRLADAHALVDQAIALAEAGGDRSGLAEAHKMRGELFHEAGLTAQALVWYDKARAEFEAIGDRRGLATALAGLAAVCITDGQTSRARELGAQALELQDELGDERTRARVILNLMGIETNVSADDPRFTQVLAIAGRLGDDDLRGSASSARGSIQFSRGDYAGAQASLESAASAYNRAGSVSDTAATYVMLGRVARAHGDEEGGLKLFQQAVDLLAPTDERYVLVQAINSTAIALANLGRMAESNAAYNRGLALARESKNAVLIDFMLGNAAGNLLDTGEFERAAEMFKEVIARQPSPYIASYRYHGLADALTGLGRNDEALEAIDESLRLTRDQKLTNLLDTRLALKTEILTKLGRPDDALAASRETLDVIDAVRSKLVPSDFLKRGYAERVQKAYARTIALLSELNRPLEALDISEQGRARAFLDLLAARDESAATLTTRGNASTELSRSGDLDSRAIAQPIQASGIREVAVRLKTTIVSYWVDELTTQVWTITPEGRMSSASLPVGRKRLTDLVAATTAALREDTTRSITTPPAAARPDASNRGADLSDLPMRGLGLLALTRDDRTAWRELYRILIAPIRRDLPSSGARVTIIPHGPLFQLAFGALQTSAGRYLVEDFDVHYAPSVSVLAYTGRRQQVVRAGASGSWVVIGNPASLPAVGGRPLAPLPGAAQEIAAIAAIGPRGRVMRLEAANATEAALAHAITESRPSVLHFATHGFVYDDAKTPPFLVLNRRGDAANEDGKLTIDEVYDLTLPTDLVVLSACRTGGGPVSSDGILGLTRAFLYAGAPTVLATFWDVSDYTTSLLIPRFYRGYATTGEKSGSLRAAQLDLLAKLRSGRVVVTISGRRITLPEHPLLWAGFFLSGEP